MSAPGAEGATAAPEEAAAVVAVEEDKHDDDARSIAGSEKSTGSTRSAIPKFSGLKRPESKIGRPCAGQAKPALPPVTPTKNSSYDYVKRVTEDVSRYKLTDVQETEEYEEDFFGNRLHTLPPRRIRNKSNSGAYYDVFEELDFFGNPLHKYPPRHSRYLSSKDDILKDFFWSTPRRSQYTSSYKRENDWFKESDSLSSSLFSTSPRRRSSIGSTGTATSMDALWELHPRRLSEAGLSRHSDSSAVLTEDTDSFIIGQRVWVGGAKPGQIAYIGETQFAPGEWAGIVLDQPIGKNDGSVGGIRYFQCEPKRGVFSRLTRLTRFPMAEIGGGDSFTCPSPSPTNGNRKSPISPSVSTRSALSVSNTSLASTHVDFKVGDRVIIKSSQGSKIGTLRYMGFTSFANGEWCGVELDEPRGKNDGSVEGKRYFDCRQNFGLFAPVSKVSKSPSNRRPGAGNCVIHPGGDMRRGTSRESLSSMASSMTSATPAARRVRLGVTSLTPKRPSPKSSAPPLPSRTALQDVLNEKQQHIEQLLKERDLERAEITRAASQADEAEQKFVNLKQEFDQYRKDSENRIKEFTMAMEKLKTEMHEALAQLDDEKRKNEDLQFKFEEAAITKGDIEVTNEANESHIKNLESELQQARALVEGDMAKLTEIKDELAKSKEENENLKVTLEHANAKRISLENEEAKSIDLVQSLQAQLEEAGEARKRLDEESTKQIETLKTQLAKQASELEVATFKYSTEIEEARAKYSVDVTAKKDEIEVLNKDLVETKSHLDRNSKELEKTKYESAAIEVGLKKDVDKLRMEMSSKIMEIETRDDSILNKDERIKTLETELGNVKAGLEDSHRQCELLKGASATNQEALIKELEELRNQFKAKSDELESTKKNAFEIDKEKTALHENRNISIKMLEETQSELQKVTAELETKIAAYETTSACVKKLEVGLQEKHDEYQKIQNKCDELATKLTQETSSLQESKTTIGKLELEVGDYQRKLQQNDAKFEELNEQKQKLETKIQQLCGSSGEDSQKLEAMNNEIRDKEVEIAKIKDASAQQIQQMQHSLQQKDIELQNATQTFEKDIVEFKNCVATLQNNEIENKRKTDHSLEERNKENEDIKKQLVEVMQQLQQREVGLKNAEENVHKLESSKKALLEESSSETQKLAQEAEAKIESLNSDIAKSNENIKQITQQFESAKAALLVQLDESKSTLENANREHEEALKNVEKELIQRSTEVNSLKKQIAEITSHLSSTKEIALTQKMEVIATLQSQLEAAHITLTEMENEKELSTLQNAQNISGFESKIQEMQVEVDASKSKIQELSAHLEATKNDVNSNLVNMESKEIQITELTSELQKAVELAHRLEKEKAGTESSSKQALEERDKQCEDFAKKVQSYADKVKEIENSKAILDAEKNNYTKVLAALKLTGAQKQDLMKNLANSNLQALVNEVKVEERDELKQQMGETQDKLKVTSAALESAKLELQKRSIEVDSLQNQLAKAQQQNVTIPEAEVEASIVNNNKVSNDYKQLLEEKLFVESQVQFLNSIIVDMQKKNEEQKMRIEILEKGYSPGDADELKLFGYADAKKTPPRLYCDICEEFDLHETEDCPQQGADDLPSPPRDNNGQKPPPRPYCDNCEMFGHLTEECEDEQTY